MLALSALVQRANLCSVMTSEEEAIDLVPEGESRSRAEAYWYSAIITNLDDNHGFMGGSMHSMADTFDELEFNDPDDDDDVYDDDDDFEMEF